MRRIRTGDSAMPSPDPSGGRAPALHFIVPPSTISLQYGTFRRWRAGIAVYRMCIFVPITHPGCRRQTKVFAILPRPCLRPQRGTRTTFAGFPSPSRPAFAGMTQWCYRKVGIFVRAGFAGTLREKSAGVVAWYSSVHFPSPPLLDSGLFVPMTTCGSRTIEMALAGILFRPTACRPGKTL